MPTSKPSTSPCPAETFLRDQGRKLYKIAGDGNCMFSAISHQVYGAEGVHVALRLTLQALVQSNIDQYKCLWIRKTPFSIHVQRMKESGWWGTQVELQAASDYFNVPVYVCLTNSAGVYSWHMFRPRYNQGLNQECRPAVFPFTLKHIELAHSSSKDHYDSVVPTTGNTRLPEPPIKLHVIDRVALD